ncbi:MAG TPA: phosphotransferase [Stellaceae bacterium]|jgi:predicted hotdog family 3-hydroxylacyl-ACP dehydratase
MIDRSQIARLIPHAGAMCLLDKVVSWDAGSIRCLTTRHRSSDNPLRRADGKIGAICAVEFAAQAMALHGRLVADTDGPPKPGILASVRDVRLHKPFLDGVIGDIAIDAVLLMGDGRSATYSFTLSAAQNRLGSGRATVIFDVADP